MTLRLSAAILSGVLFALSFPNYSLGWLMFVALIPLLVALARAQSWREAFLLGWVSLTIAWLMMVPWVVRVMSHYGGLPLVTGILIYIAMCAILGLYGALFAVIVYRIAPADNFLRWLLVPLAWAAIEYARTFLLTGFPWNLIAAAIVDYTALVQFDRVAGPYALGVLILIPAATIAWVIVARARGMRLAAPVAAVAIFCFLWWVTGLVATKLIARPQVGPTYTAALLQPNISQEMRWDAASLTEIFQRMLNMTDTAIRSGATTVIWPESTVPLSFSSTAFFKETIESLSRRASVDIILGSIAEDAKDPERIWNSAFLVSGGRTIGHYDKMRLVPFGEYVPLRKMIVFAHKLVHAVGNFQFGTNDHPLAGALRYGPAICYEIVYPQIARTQVVNGAEVLVTITNDAWYDGTAAPPQHLNQARLRAVETDRYLLRAATTGISAFVDPAGRVIEEMPMNRQAIIYARFQPRHSTTLYVRFGDWFAWVACVVTLIAIVRRRKRDEV